VQSEICNQNESEFQKLFLSSVRNSGLNNRFNDKKIWEKDMKSKIKNPKSKIISNPQSAIPGPDLVKERGVSRKSISKSMIAKPCRAYNCAIWH